MKVDFNTQMTLWGYAIQGEVTPRDPMTLWLEERGNAWVEASKGPLFDKDESYLNNTRATTYAYALLPHYVWRLKKELPIAHG